MKGLLDHIFDNLDIQNLDKQQVKEYQLYLQEILPQLTSNDAKIKFLASRVKLNKRLIDLDCITVTEVDKNIERLRKEIIQKRSK